jgi:hypothetical protein
VTLADLGRGLWFLVGIDPVETDVLVGRDLETTYDLCKQALHEVLHAMTTSNDSTKREINTLLQWGDFPSDARGGSFTKGFTYDLSFMLDPLGETKTRVRIRSVRSVTAQWRSREQRLSAVLDLAHWLHDRAPAS